MDKLLFIIFLSGQFACRHDREIYFAFDDLPAISNDFKDIQYKQSLIEKFFQTFSKYEVPAI